MNNYVQKNADKITTSILNGLKLGLGNGNQETFENVEMIKEMVEKLCKTELELEKGKQLISNFDCESFEDFDREYKKMLAENPTSALLPKQTERYQDFVKNLEDIQTASVESQADTSTLNQSVTVDGMNVLSHTVTMDPITKTLIKDPVKNKICKHIYDKESILGSIRLNSRIRCPYVGCSNKQPVRASDLEEDRELKRKIIQQQQQTQRDLEEDSDEEE